MPRLRLLLNILTFYSLGKFILIQTTGVKNQMSMALKADVALACRASGTEKPINLVHLSSMTMGDRTLEIEVLKMFACQIPQFMALLDNASTEDELCRTAHTIKGAARSIGALKLADIIEITEDTARYDRQQVADEMDKIKRYIVDLGTA
jgi:HPt (histidine-containing phosphotransfer) domain-containing protein